MRIQSKDEFPVILTRKITAPSAPYDVLQRERLISLLQEYSEHPVTLIQAPAGYGKSCLMSSWVEHADASCAWVTLDAEDRALDRFWAYVLGALIYEGIIDDTLLPDTKNLQTPSEALPIVENLLTKLEQYEDKVILFIDDYHTIHKDSPVHSSFSYFLMHVPHNVHVVISSRTQPSLGLSKLQVQGHMGRITDSELKFTLDEVESYYEQTNVPLSKEEAELVFGRTQGWAVAIKLLSVSEDYPSVVAEFRSYSQAKEIVGDYLFDEIINQLDNETYQFLAATCCLESFSVPLALHILGSEEETVLSSINYFVENNLFITRFVERNGVVWYRYHSLFAEAALQHYLGKDPVCIINTRKKALEWYEENSYLDEAIRTAAFLGDYGTVKRFILDYWSMHCTADNYVRLMRWFEFLPQGYSETHTVLASIESLPLALTGKTDVALRRIHEAEKSLVNKEGELFGFVMGFKALVICLFDDVMETRRVSELALENLASEEVYLININLQLLAGTYSELNPEKAIQIYETSLLELEAIQRNEIFRYSVQCCLCVLNSVIGHFAEAKKWAAKAMGSYTEPEHPLHPIFLYCYVGRMNMLYQRAELEAAEESADYALRHAYDCWTPVLIGQVHGFMAIKSFLAHNNEASKKSVTEALYLSAVGFARNYPALPALSYWLSEGALFKEHFEVKDAGITPDPLVWVHYAMEYIEGNYSGIEQLTTYFETLPERRLLAKLHFTFLIALFYEAVGQPEQADSWFSEYLELAESMEAEQACFENSALIQPLLKRQVETKGSHYVAQLYKELSLKGYKKQAGVAGEPELTVREKETMELICKGLSTKEIAQALFISYETAKKHISNSYQKLGAHTRVQAVSRFEALSRK